MANKMLIDAAHPEETRVVVVRGSKVEEFDFESANRRQLRGNIYLAKVTRVEPSLQAAFVEYGGNRHGFLAFSEIHPDYYQIPVADRQALLEEEARADRDEEREDERRRHHHRRRRGMARRRRGDETVRAEATANEALGTDLAGDDAVAPTAGEPAADPHAAEAAAPQSDAADATSGDLEAGTAAADRAAEPDEPQASLLQEAEPGESAGEPNDSALAGDADAHASGESALDSREPEARRESSPDNGQNGEDDHDEDEDAVEQVGGDALEEAHERRRPMRRQYKIQEVIKRRQILLVQVVKEERGTKGAALTTYLSLAGRYSVLMPNTGKGGGISRKITSAEDRKRLKEIAQELEVPEGMGVILRTAGASRTKAEIKRDFEYLMRLWESVRELTMKSSAPALVYEEGSLIKRAIRDLYNKDIDEVLVAGDDAYSEAKDFMRTLMPSHAKNVKPYRDTQPIFTRYGVESQLDAMFSPVVQLKSGGYIVLNQAEALVAIDVNSGRATREHHIEDTALKTNVEAADEVARQLRLRDLAGLIVIDFIDMDEKRNNRAVERRLKESLKHDRARIQVGRISHFGLMEMSRQRIRSSVLESSTEKCPHCGGMGHVRSVGSVALQLLRSLEEMLIKGATHNLTVRTRADVALYVLNHKRAHLRELETRFRITIAVNADPAIVGQQPFVIERGEQVHSVEAAKAIAAQLPSVPIEIEEEDDEEETVEEDPAEVRIGAEPEPERKHRRRRRRRRGGEERQPAEFVHDTDAEHTVVDAEDHESEAAQGEEADETEPADQREAGLESREDAERRRRRRGRRGGRRNRREREESGPFADSGSMEPEVSSAVADFDRPWMPSEPAAKESGEPPQMEPAAGGESTPTYRAPVTTALVPPPEQPEQPMSSERPMAPAEEPPRRRSTVREPAPFVIGSGEAPVAPPPPPSAPPQPSAEPPEEAEQPRRTGWWSRRLMGGSKG
ncbi:MAG: ribonuclease E/G [Xanthobacteraceae bacterium]